MREQEEKDVILLRKGVQGPIFGVLKKARLRKWVRDVIVKERTAYISRLENEGVDTVTANSQESVEEFIDMLDARSCCFAMYASDLFEQHTTMITTTTSATPAVGGGMNAEMQQQQQSSSARPLAVDATGNIINRPGEGGERTSHMRTPLKKNMVYHTTTTTTRLRRSPLNAH